MTSNIRNFASIMVCVGLSSGAENRVVLAASLASRFGSRLIGVAAEDAAVPYLEDGLGTARPILVENARNAALEDLAQAETNFRRGVGFLSDIEWRCNTQEPTAFITGQARAAAFVRIRVSGSYGWLAQLDETEIALVELDDELSFPGGRQHHEWFARLHDRTAFDGPGDQDMVLSEVERRR